MARPRKILANKSETSNLTKEQKEQKKKEEQLATTGSEQLNKPPAWLRDVVAKKEWNRLLEQLKKIGVIGNLDYNDLGAYCNSFSSYLEITNKMKGEPFVIEYTNKMGKTNIIQNPYITAQLKYSEEMRKFASLLGITIDSRLKMASLKISTEKNKIEDEFGEI